MTYLKLNNKKSGKIRGIRRIDYIDIMGGATRSELESVLSLKKELL